MAPELSLGFTFAGIGSAMFAAGLLNLLPEAALAVGLGGLVLLVRGLIRRAPRPAFTLGEAFFIAACALLALRLYGEQLVYIDNFTHWETAILHLLRKDRFPNFQDSYIRFQSYPLGTAALVYYFSRIGGLQAEWFQMLIHWACAAAMLSGLFALARRVPAKAACFVGGLLLLCADNEFIQLLVDSTLGLVALGAVAYCVRYRGELKQRALWVTPWLIYLIAVKNSGALFAIFVLALVLVWGGWRRALAVGAASLSFLFLWNRHVAYVFEAGMTSQHSMSIEHFKRMLSIKKPGSVQTILHRFLGQVVSLNNAYLPVLLFSAALLALAILYLKGDRAVRGLLIYGAVCYLIYQAGMLGMYVFTMQEKEALRLASFERYHGTIWIFSTGIALMATMLAADRAWEIPRRRALAAIGCAACVAAMALSGMPKPGYYTRYMDEDTLSTLAIRQETDALIATYALPEGAAYYLLVDDDFTSAETAYLYNMVNCLLLADDVQVRKLGQVFSAEEISRCDYLVGFGQTPEIQAYMKDNFNADARVIALK